MNKLLLAGAAALAVLAGCASGPTIRSNIDPSANLSGYKTYMFPEQTGTDRGGVSTPITSYFKEAIRREMDARGYRYVEGGPADLLVNFNANSQENVDVRTTPGSTYGYGYGYYGYRGGMYGASAFPPEVADRSLQDRHRQCRRRRPLQEAGRLGGHRGSAPDRQDDERPAYGHQQRHRRDVPAVSGPGRRRLMTAGGDATSDSDSARATFERALAFLRAGDGAMAEQLCRAALADLPAEPNLTALLGAALNRQGRGAEAEPLLRRALVELPQYAKGHEELGRALLQLGRIDEAIGLLRQAVALDPKLQSAQLALVHALAESGRSDEADAAMQDFPARRSCTRAARQGGRIPSRRQARGGRRFLSADTRARPQARRGTATARAHRHAVRALRPGRTAPEARGRGRAGLPGRHGSTSRAPSSSGSTSRRRPQASGAPPSSARTRPT